MNQTYYGPEYLNYLEALKEADQVVKAKIGFRWHLATYVIINLFLIMIYLETSLQGGALYYPWFLWVIGGWGIGLAFNFLAVYVFNDTLSRRHRMLETELQRMGVRRNPEWSLFLPRDDAKSN